MTLQKKCTYQLLFKRTKVALLFFIILCASAHANAQEFRSTSAYPVSQQKSQAVQANQTASYNSYEPTTYAPFSDETPSSAGQNNNGPSKISNRRNGFFTPEDPGEKTPLGDAWSLLIFAALAAGAIYFKQRKKCKAKA